MGNATLRVRQTPAPEETLEQRCRRERDTARLVWVSRPSRAVSEQVRWRRHFSSEDYPEGVLRRLLPQLEQKTRELGQMVAKPEPWVSGETWTRAAERLEEYQAQAAAIRHVLKSLSSGSERSG